jgi:hypothetical protein
LTDADKSGKIPLTRDKRQDGNCLQFFGVPNFFMNTFARILNPFCWLAMLAVAQDSIAQIQYVVLQHAGGNQVSFYAVGTTSSYQVGYSQYMSPGEQNYQPMFFSGSADSAVALPRPDSYYKVQAKATGISGSQIVGWTGTLPNYSIHACIWQLPSLSIVDLAPSGVYDSAAMATSGSQQVGYVRIVQQGIGIVQHAALWSGAAASFVDLNPAGSTYSEADATSGSQQVGMAFNHAALWSGAAASFVDLNPAGSTYSAARGISDSQQVGYASGPQGYHAALWSGTANSFVDLHPAGSAADESSSAYATIGSHQVGQAFSQGAEYSRAGGFLNDLEPQGHAALWCGTAASFVDLHSVLNPIYAASEAKGIFRDGNTLYVVGDALDTTGRYEANDAILWIVAMPTIGNYSFKTTTDTAATIAGAKILSTAVDPGGNPLTITSVSSPSAKGGTVTVGPGSVTYTPPAGYAGIDTFTVTISNGHGGIATGTITATVIAPPSGSGNGLNTATIAVGAEGTKLVFYGIPGKAYRIQRSGDLSPWATIATVTAASNGKIQYTDASPTASAGYYRTATAP